MSETLYRFSLDPDTVKIVRQEIPEWYIVTRGYLRKTVYRYKLNRRIYETKADNIDTYSYNSVHSFNPDIEHARQIMLEYFKAEAVKATIKLNKYNQMYNCLKENKDDKG